MVKRTYTIEEDKHSSYSLYTIKYNGESIKETNDFDEVLTTIIEHHEGLDPNALNLGQLFSL